jgi:hypothetical protein
MGTTRVIGLDTAYGLAEHTYYGMPMFTMDEPEGKINGQFRPRN